MSATITNREARTLEGFGFSTARARRKLRRERDLASKRANREAREARETSNRERGRS